MMIESQDIARMLANPPTPISAPVSQDLGFSLQGEVCDSFQLVKDYEFINYSGINFLKIYLCPDVHAGNVDTHKITKSLLEEQGLTFSRSEVKFIETQIFGKPDKRQTDLMVPLDENNEIRAISLDGQTITLNSFALIYNFEDHGKDSDDINGCLSGGAIATLAIYGGIQSLREKGKRRRNSHRPIAIIPKNGTVNLGTVGDQEKPTTVDVKMPLFGSTTEKNIGNIDFMAESRKRERVAQDQKAVAWKEIEELDRFSTLDRIEASNNRIKEQKGVGWVVYGTGNATVCKDGKTVFFTDPNRPELDARPVILTEAERNDPKTIKWLKTLIPQK